MLKANKTIKYKNILVTEGVFNGNINNPKITFDGGLIEKEHFSPQQLQDIVDGKLKEDKINVECEKIYCDINSKKITNIRIDSPTLIHEYEKAELMASIIKYQIKLDPHITIHPIEQPETYKLAEPYRDAFGNVVKDELVKVQLETYTREQIEKILIEYTKDLPYWDTLFNGNRLDNCKKWVEQKLNKQ